MTFNELRSANAKRHIEWWHGQPISLSFRGCELAGETGEACNVINKLERKAAGLVGSKSDISSLAEELADVVICADLIAMDAGIDLGDAVRDKFNKTSRKYSMKTRV